MLEMKDSISGDIFISTQRVKENAVKFSNSLEVELHRVIIHGILHLLGYGDSTKDEKCLMRRKENLYLEILTGLLSVN
jgi:rRNA maturation RNase YbeY